MNTLPITIDRCELTRVSLEISESADVHEWKRIGKSLCAVNECALWWIGDWINHGVAAYGEKYAEAMNTFGCEVAGEIGYSLETMKKAAAVAAHVEKGNRLPQLTWTHHFIVYLKPPAVQRKWLKMAAKENWSVKQLKAELKADDADPLAGVTHDPKPDINVKLLAVTSWFQRLELAKIETDRLKLLKSDIDTKLIPIKEAIEAELQRRAA